MTNQVYMKDFREARQTMGFSQTSAFVPNSRMAEFSIYVDRLKAERMIEICEDTLPSSRERKALSGRNLMNIPSAEEVKALLARNPNQPAINRLVAKLQERLELAVTALNVAKMEDEDDDYKKWMSWAVAHNHMANVMWRELAHMEKLLERKDG